MAIGNAAQSETKKVSDPNAAYDSLKSQWSRSKAVCSGERFVKDYDSIVKMSNFLIPFSPSMTQDQYNFYKAEAEFPGITAQFARTLIGGLLRKKPILKLPEEVPEEATNWLINDFCQDDSSLIAFLDLSLWEEIRTSRCWIYIDHPKVEDIDSLSKEEREALKPYPVLWDADFIINWKTGKNDAGKKILTQVITKGYITNYEKNEFHPTLIDTVWVHELNEESGNYQIRVFQKDTPSDTVPVLSGNIQKNISPSEAVFTLKDTLTDFEMNDKPLKVIPVWPLNGSIEPVEPILTSIIDKEIALYNKISRRNHLLYGAATYTPIIKSDMEDTKFQTIVDAGLGTWIKLGEEDDADILKTPTDALNDYSEAIAAAIEEMAKLGIRMLTPETDQSGIALHLRSAPQTAQLGTLNSKVSTTMQSIVAFMIDWKYDIQIDPSEVDFTLSSDFSSLPVGPDWMRLVTDWYEAGLLPRTLWLQILKRNDIVPPDYDDEDGKKEINSDDLIFNEPNDKYAKDVTKE